MAPIRDWTGAIVRFEDYRDNFYFISFSERVEPSV